MEQHPYSAGGVKWSFWFLEFKKTVDLLQSGLTLDEIRQKNVVENLFAASSDDRSVLIMNTVAGRIRSLPAPFLPLFAQADLATQKLFCLMSCLCQDTLFFEFVYEVIREKMLLGTNTYTDRDLRIFFSGKQQQSEKAAKWTDQTIRRLGRYYKTMLFESGMTDKGREERRIFRPILSSETENWMKENGLTPVWKALEGIA